MVYCTKCGTKNPDDSRFCTKCGDSLYAVKEEQGDECFGRPDTECFGGRATRPQSGIIFGIVFGFMLLVAGLLWLLRQARIIPVYVEIWPFAVIIFGILIVVGALYGMRR